MTDQDKSPDAFLRAMEEREKDPSKRGRRLPDDFASRPVGVFLLSLALLLFWTNVYMPISEARAGVATIQYSGKSVFVQPLFFMLGLVYTILGTRSAKFLGPTTRPSVGGWIFTAIAVGLGFAYSHYIEAYLQTLGYTV